ncbi:MULTISPECIES: lipocalin family protein [Flavobacteriaceae]|uniref:lipocalin family protein n=1 Tax=Flavobacteriaceae TaxID=49546 RepID=UPI00234A931F|nr:lipocalin family protein [Muricauda sp. SP22]MDC6363629.1 lipocalin family protein [Muricauda sp. SP22]
MSFSLLLQTGCSNDDSEPIPEPTVHELLMSGRWYVQSVVSAGELDYCVRTTYYDFVSEQTMIAELFNLVDGECESVDYGALDYEVINDAEIRFTLNDGETYIYWEIISISEEELVTQRLNTGAIITYDKTEG